MTAGKPGGFWREVLRMWGARHGINWHSPAWIVALLSSFGSVIGIITTDGAWRTALWAIFGVSAFFELITLLYVLPARVWQRDTDALKNELSRLAPLQEFQERQAESPCPYFSIQFETAEVNLREPYLVLHGVIRSRLIHGVTVDRLEALLRLGRAPLVSFHPVNSLVRVQGVSRISHGLTNLMLVPSGDVRPLIDELKRRLGRPVMLTGYLDLRINGVSYRINPLMNEHGGTGQRVDVEEHASRVAVRFVRGSRPSPRAER